MKRLIFACAALLLCSAGMAQQQTPVENPAARKISIPQYAYCQIIANTLPVYGGDGVLFDFGQPTEAWTYNWLRDAKGDKYRFKSGIDALNHMIFRGWEFVQVYTSGEKSQSIHYLLRIPTAKLSPEQLQQLCGEPETKKTGKNRK